MQLRSAQLGGDCVVKVGDGPNLAGRASTFLSDAPAQAIGIADLVSSLVSSRYLLSMG